MTDRFIIKFRVYGILEGRSLLLYSTESYENAEEYINNFVGDASELWIQKVWVPKLQNMDGL